MRVEDKLKVQEEIETSISRFYTTKKALDLALRNNSSGLQPITKPLKEAFLVAYFNLKKEYEGLLDSHVADSNSVSPLVSSKLLDIYGKILSSIRALENSSMSRNHNYFTKYKEYDFPKTQSEEISDLKLVSEEFIEDIRATREESTSFSDEENFA